MNESKSYIYIYLDPSKKGKYCYNDICFLYEPFYVGKGKNGRYRDLYNNRNSHFRKKIDEIIKFSNLGPIIIKLFENLNDDHAYIIEKQLVQEIGRIRVGSGPLFNLTDGGKGLCGEDHRGKNWSLKGKLRFGVDAPFFGKSHSEKTKNKMIISHSGKKISEETKNKLSESIRKNVEKNTKSGRHPLQVLTIKTVTQIKKLFKLGFKNIEISKIYGVSPTTILKIKQCKSWIHVK